MVQASRGCIWIGIRATDKRKRRQMTRPSRRQHFIARFYLRNFAEPMFSDKLLVYTREAGCWEDRTPNGIGWFPHLLSVISNAGKRTDEFDQFFKRQVEDPAAPALKKMAEGQCVNDRERSAIAVFIALTAARSPDLLGATRNEYLKGTSDKERERSQRRQTMHRATDFVVASQRDFPGREFFKQWTQRSRQEKRTGVDLTRPGCCERRFDVSRQSDPASQSLGRSGIRVEWGQSLNSE